MSDGNNAGFKYFPPEYEQRAPDEMLQGVCLYFSLGYGPGADFTEFQSEFINDESNVHSSTLVALRNDSGTVKSECGRIEWDQMAHDPILTLSNPFGHVAREFDREDKFLRFDGDVSFRLPEHFGRNATPYMSIGKTLRVGDVLILQEAGLKYTSYNGNPYLEEDLRICFLWPTEFINQHLKGSPSERDR